ncbi:hypothetical protein ILUMI_21385 [Ignelater luminosus]|uniref:Uncharacterized protein n=1 Tax=Ignelater luminosus TaxID=2038154 RepID=A0A8K0CHU6_IGNLU|nr:hypothetical protein ILUMI_21385 [Ignelater luminosus]
MDLSIVYSDPSNPAKFPGANLFTRHIGYNHTTECKTGYKSKILYTIHKPIIRKFPRNKYNNNNRKFIYKNGTKAKFKEDQLVRISRSKNIFEKGYTNNIVVTKYLKAARLQIIGSK